jgi:hypothetical protein
MVGLRRPSQETCAKVQKMAQMIAQLNTFRRYSQEKTNMERRRQALGRNITRSISIKSAAKLPELAVHVDPSVQA